VCYVACVPRTCTILCVIYCVYYIGTWSLQLVEFKKRTARAACELVKLALPFGKRYICHVPLSRPVRDDCTRFEQDTSPPRPTVRITRI
jgi:hypothetical protein